MDHFSPADWIDFTRGLLSGPESAALQSHLDQGCEECLKSWNVWRSVHECLSPETQYRPPDQALKYVRAAYVADRPWKWLVEAARWAELVFDSLRQPAPAPVRGSTSLGRQLVHEAEPFVIDVRLETDAKRNRILLIGQILDSEHPNEPMRGVDILLLNSEDLIAKTRASSSGEFDLQCERADNLRLFINIRGQRAIGIALPDVETRTAALSGEPSV